MIPPIIDIGGVLLSSDIFTECFCCDLDACHGACCVEGDAGAPVTLDEIAELEDALDEVWPRLSASAQGVIERQGVAYTDKDGDLVTSIVAGRDCVFACREGLCTLCTVEARKPISCALYPIRELRMGDGTVGLNYHRWPICRAAVEKGRKTGLPLWQFLRGPLIRRFGQEWYTELEEAARMLTESQGKTEDRGRNS